MTTAAAAPQIVLLRDHDGTVAEASVGGCPAEVLDGSDSFVMLRCDLDDAANVPLSTFPDVRLQLARAGDDIEVYRAGGTICFATFCEPSREDMDRWGAKALLDEICGLLDDASCGIELFERHDPTFLQVVVSRPMNGTIGEVVQEVELAVIALITAATTRLSVRGCSRQDA
jgi:hypothetical protein